MVKGGPIIHLSDVTVLHKKGTHILQMAGHITAIIDTAILDDWFVVIFQFIKYGKLIICSFIFSFTNNERMRI
jgi:hypothetical protein